MTHDTDPPNAYGGWDHDGHPDNEKGLAIMQIDATYSPDDNKLRLYASQRLDAETYARVKGAGFSWAPKQGFFVAPMWTPERADLCIELAGDIGDFLDERFSGEALPLFDKIVMNPPFNGGDDIRHILAARKLLRPGGRLVAICAGGPRQAKALEHLADLWEPLPAGTFAQAGTNVSTVLLTMEAPEAEEPCEDDPDGVHSVGCGCEA